MESTIAENLKRLGSTALRLPITEFAHKAANPNNSSDRPKSAQATKHLG